ncbi:S41 family peptidase [Lutibacter citreus]|uniref:S41 family peptidase n=1 Tax=Lutibacter citreus TaxID=2138210 RepID=UPI000DBE7826|nr:S41 family peptidase [Lutibacter citreus]
MIKLKSLIALLLFTSILFTSCKDDDDDIRTELPSEIDFSQVEVQDFIWQGLNFWYLWKENVPKLDDSKLEDAQVYYDLLSSYDDPEAFFDDLIYEPESVDVFSWIVDDYVALENSFSGITKSTGAKIWYSYEKDINSNVFGYVQYVSADTEAANKNIKRGDIFNTVDGVQITINNYRSLFKDDGTYTLGFADLNGGNPISNGVTKELTPIQLTENPVHIVKTLDIEGTKIGYLMFNGFDAGFELKIDEAFAQLKAEGATKLVLDLRYNRGGYDYITSQVVSSITGQFAGEILKKDNYNPLVQKLYEDNFPDQLVSRFTTKVTNIEGTVLKETLSSLNMTELYVLTSDDTASASEVLISGLDPYIDVHTIGTTTYGKYTGSITLYDSDNFMKSGDNLNTNHTYAMQPIILKYTNINDVSVRGGIIPEIELPEYLSTLGVLGDPSEPLLAKAIEKITGLSAKKGKSLSLKEEKLVELKKIPNLNKFDSEFIITGKFPFLRTK